MDQLKIGRFIAECRKEKKLTQAQLAERLGITDKAISKWERGIAMPDSSIMLEVCEILGINVNELLSGERIDIAEQNKKNEELLLEFTRKEEGLRKKLLINSWMLECLVFLAYIITAVMAMLAYPGCPIASIIAMAVSTAIFLVGSLINLKMEFDAGVFVCQNCQHEFVPKFKDALFPIGTAKNYRIRVTCPKCGEKTWAKKILPK